MAIADVAARTAKPRVKEYKLTDSQGLYLLVKPTCSKRWYLKYRFEGKESRVAFHTLYSPASASSGVPLQHLCNCIESGHLSVQAWRGEHCTLRIKQKFFNTIKFLHKNIVQNITTEN